MPLLLRHSIPYPVAGAASVLATACSPSSIEQGKELRAASGGWLLADGSTTCAVQPIASPGVCAPSFLVGSSGWGIACKWAYAGRIGIALHGLGHNPTTPGSADRARCCPPFFGNRGGSSVPPPAFLRRFFYSWLLRIVWLLRCKRRDACRNKGRNCGVFSG